MSKNIKFSLSAIEAKDLLAGDSNGFSDPYFKIPHHQNGVVDLPGKKNRTKVIKKTLNPVWNHTFEIEFNPQKCNKLNIEVFDYDIIGKDDPIGNATINLDWMISGRQDTFDQWIPLTVKVPVMQIYLPSQERSHYPLQVNMKKEDSQDSAQYQ